MSQPVNTFTNPLKVTSDSVLDVTSSGATNIFTNTLSIGNCKLSIAGGQSVPGNVQINGGVSLTAARRPSTSRTTTCSRYMAPSAGLRG